LLKIIINIGIQINGICDFFIEEIELFEKAIIVLKKKVLEQMVGVQTDLKTLPLC
jgi:hypothetical protein